MECPASMTESSVEWRQVGIRGQGSARALLPPGGAQLDGENIIMYGKGEPGTMRGYCLSGAGNLTATEC